MAAGPMRCFILGFAIGVWWLQRQSALPQADLLWSCSMAGVAALAASVAIAIHRRSGGREPIGLRIAGSALCIVAGSAAGFLHAASSAERRMADELPARWEGQDIQLIGVVRGLPAVNQSDRS